MPKPISITASAQPLNFPCLTTSKRLFIAYWSTAVCPALIVDIQGQVLFKCASFSIAAVVKCCIFAKDEIDETNYWWTNWQTEGWTISLVEKRGLVYKAVRKKNWNRSEYGKLIQPLGRLVDRSVIWSVYKSARWLTVRPVRKFDG